MSPLDPATLTSLKALDPDGGRGLLGRLIDAFDRTLERQLGELDAGLQQGPDWARLGRAAHTLKSAAAHLAALDAAAQCQALEQLCQTQEPEAAAQAAVALRSSLLSAQAALHGLRPASP